MYQINYDDQCQSYILKVTYSRFLVFTFTREWKVKTKKDLRRLKWYHDKIMGTDFTMIPDDLIDVNINYSLDYCINNNNMIVT